MGSSSWKRPRSYSIMATTDVTHLVIEYARNTVSSSKGFAASTFAKPLAWRYTSFPLLATAVIMPGTLPAATQPLAQLEMCPKRRGHSPTSEGWAGGRGRDRGAPPIISRLLLLFLRR
eukprot:scaffold282253_cov29-Tisochrysis_lutea.AAC.1